MKIKRQFRLLILTMAAGMLAMPVSAIAGHYKGSCCKMKGSVVYNQYDNKFYPVASAYHCYNCKYKHRYCHTMVKVKCVPTAGYWWGYTWMSSGQTCYYVR